MEDFMENKDFSCNSVENTLKDDNSKLNQKCLNLEKQLTELTFKNENFQKQLDDKQKGDENTNQLIESLCGR